MGPGRVRRFATVALGIVVSVGLLLTVLVGTALLSWSGPMFDEDADVPDNDVPGEYGELPEEAPQAAAPAGWRWHSTGSVQFLVPEAWKSGACGQGSADRVVLCGKGGERAELAEYPGLPRGSEPPALGLTYPPGPGGLPSYAVGPRGGSVWLRAEGIVLNVVAGDRKTVHRMIHSLNVPEDLDANGCSSDDDDLPLGPAPATGMVPADTVAISLCGYPPTYPDSVSPGEFSLLVRDAGALAEDLNEARTPCDASAPWGHLVLVAKTASGDRSVLYVRGADCLTNGRTSVKLPASLSARLP